MRISIAPPIRAYVPGGLPSGPKASAEPPKSPPLPTTIDLTRQLKFGESEVDEAGVVLVELSVLSYSNLDDIRRAVDTLGFDDCRVMDAGPDRMTDWNWLAERAANASRKPIDISAMWLRPLKGSLGLPLSPLGRGLLGTGLVGGALAGLHLPGVSPIQLPMPDAPNADVAKAAIPKQPVPKPAITAARPAAASPPASKVGADAEFIRRSRPPRALAVLQGSDALIVFRGTQTLRDVALDFCCGPAPAWPLRHEGFHTTWHEVKYQVETWLADVESKLGHKPNVYLGGHSLGGAVATLAAVDLARSHGVARVVTLGCPRPGGWLFRKLYRTSPAAPAADGAPRSLCDVTTRWVHGVDLIATLLPPPVATAHVVDALELRATDHLDVQDYFTSNFMDATPLANLVARFAQKPPGPLDLRQADPAPWEPDARRAIGQATLWLAVALPWDWWTRLFLPLIPLMTAYLARSSRHHSSQRYLGFMPPTALFRAMYPPRVVPAAGQKLPP